MATVTQGRITLNSMATLFFETVESLNVLLRNKRTIIFRIFFIFMIVYFC